MSVTDKYQTFLRHYLARGAVGVSVGLAAVAPAPSAASTEPVSHEQAAARSFADRLGMVRSAASKLADESEILLAQGVARPPPGTIFRPPPPVKQFDNWGKATFKDTWKNFANVPQPKK
jgi:hypothetical protein